MINLFRNLLLFIVAIISTAFYFQHHTSKKELYILVGRAQGTTYNIRYIYSSPIVDSQNIHQLLSEIDHSLSLYQSTSLISQFNQANRGVKADIHLLSVITKSLQVSKASNGSFDITSKPISMLWGFNASIPKKIPSKERLLQTLKYVGSNHLSLKNDSLIKDHPKTQIDCDGIAQGYTVDQIALLLRKKGITDYMVELGGEVFASGKNLSGNDWIIGIEQPSMVPGKDQFIGKKINLSGLAVTTSGSMKKFRKLGKSYWSHIVDPRTAFPVNNGIVSVTVIAPDAMTADALDNAFMVMGVNKAMRLANSLDSIGLYIVYASKEGSLNDTSNAVFTRYLK
jgi:thiamine biosynthesis lipoprotein